MAQTIERSHLNHRKKIAAILAGTLAIIAAVSAILWATGDKQASKATTLQRIKRGDSFHVLLRHSFGNLAAGQTYYATYDPSFGTMAVTGFDAVRKTPNFTMSYPCRNIDEGRIDLWGHQFFIEHDQIIDHSAGASGKIQFDSDGE